MVKTDLTHGEYQPDMTRARKLVSGSALSVGGQGLNQIVGLVVLALLARHLDARDFGTVAVVVLVLDLTRDVMLAGLPDFLVRMPTWDRRLASAAFWFQTASGLVLGGLAVACGLAVDGLGMPEIGMVAMALAPLYLVEALAAVPQARLRHELRFAPVAFATVVGAFAGGVAAVWVVLAGGGLWALVAGRLIGALVSTAVVLFTSRWRPSWPDFAGLSPALSFASRLAGGKLFGALNVKATDLIIGFVGGPVLLGAYQLAAKPLNLVLQVLLGQLQTIALSALSPVEKTEELAKSAVHLIGVAALVIFPVAAGLAAIAPEFVALVFGERWSGLAAPMAVLALAGLPATVNYMLAPTLTKLDRPGSILAFAATLTVVGVALTASAVGWGLLAVAGAFFLRTSLGSGLAVVMLTRHAGIGWLDLGASLCRPLVASLGIFVAVTLARELLPPMILPAQLACLTVTGMATYALFLAPWALRQRGASAGRPAAT